MTKKDLLKRIKSLEEYLSVSYAPADDKDDYGQHIGYKWSIGERVSELEKSKGIKLK